MRKLSLFSAVLSLFLLVPASIIWAQTISSQKGLTTAVFSTQYGNVKVYLPDDIRPGDMISGTVIAEPSGNNVRQKEKNLSELLKHSVRFNNEVFPVNNQQTVFGFTASNDGQHLQNIELGDAGRSKWQTLKIPADPVPAKKDSVPPNKPGGGGDPGDYLPWRKQSSLELCVFPSHALAGSPANIPGPFDGNSSNTQCTIGVQPVSILAESPRSCVINFPENASGLQPAQIKENGRELCSNQISGVDMQVTTGDLNLRKGQSTFIDVKLTGLQNLPDKAILTIVNTTPNVVTMTNGNTQVIPVWPPPDSANGTFFIHCPATGITTGNFVVEINLDLPQPGDALTPASECPPGYTKKSCDCGAAVKVSRTGNSLTAVATPQCKGVWGVGINTFPVCSVLKTEYSWAVKDGKENVELVGKTDGKSVTIKPKNNRGFTVCVTVTVTCIDGTVCTATDCITQSGETVPPPPSSKCGCSASCSITAGATAGMISGFSATVNAKCTGTSGTGDTRVVCTVGKITYSWSIGASGKDVAEIDGKADGPDVKVKRKKEGPYNLYLSGTVTCSDGTTCDFSCNAEIPYIPTTNEKVCLPDVKENGEPKMVGGLKNKQTGPGSTNIIFRDEFIALEAVGSDVDMVTFFCNPIQPCPDSKSEKTIAVTGKVRFEWAITGGEGRFVKLGCGSEDEKKDKGEHVIFQPPYVALPVKNADTSVITTIDLFIIDDGSPVTDAPVRKTITIKTSRKKTLPDKYTVDITGGLPDKAGSPATPANIGSCELVGPTWKPGDNLAVPEIILPGVADANKMVLGQWIVLKTQDQSDPDPLAFNCVSKNCTSSGDGKAYPDKIIWEWTKSGGGDFVLGNNGQYVIYQAPMEMPAGKEVIEIKINLKVMNPGGERKDPDKTSKEFTLYVYQPGVKLAHPGMAWLPEENNSLELKSELMYKAGGKWLPALSHMCRIHYFELMNVSTEKGVCLNAPIPKDADDCRDLNLKNEGEQEAWDGEKTSVSKKCNSKDLYQQARTKRPEKEYTITVHSRDFGSYGFLRSFANVNKKTSLEGKPVYISIPVKKEDVKHPNGRLKKMEYKDNRVTIPHDIDENRIADGGWTVAGGVLVPDPANNNEDEDDKPTGDGFKGDGLSTYEEYRGFKVLDGDDVAHSRTNYLKKDIFVRNENELDLAVYVKVSGLQVHEINDKQYVDDKTRVVNANFNTSTHANFNQMGLHLADKHRSGNLLGIAESITGQPTIPNQEKQIKIFSMKIAEVCDERKIKLPDKIAAVVAHELLHGNNVCHHGEQNDKSEKPFDLKQGLRSGNVSCVMRYDNVGTVVPGFDPEAIGSSLCDSSAGTGYNANSGAFGDAAAKRGNCKGQIRVSGKVTSPKTCGNR